MNAKCTQNGEQKSQWVKFSLRLEDMGIEQNIPTALNFNIIGEEFESKN